MGDRRDVSTMYDDCDFRFDRTNVIDRRWQPCMVPDVDGMDRWALVSVLAYTVCMDSFR